MARDWKSITLSRTVLTLALMIEAGFIAGVIATAALTKKRNGFVVVSEEPIDTVRDIHISSSVLWRALPVFILTLFNILYVAIVCSAAQRQPFVGLKTTKRRPGHSNAKKTLLLDYPSIPIFYSWAVAFGNGHFHLFGAMLVQLLASIALTPLTSNLFTPGSIQQPSDVELRTSTILNLSLTSTNTDIQTALGLSSAIWSYGAAPPVWMTTNFSLEALLPEDIVIGDVSLQTSAYTAVPQCRLVPSTEINGSYEANSAAGSYLFTFADRGCEIKDVDAFAIISTEDVYSYTWFQSCSDSRHAQDRIGIFSGVYDAASKDRLSNIVVVSCFPTYWNASADSTISFDAGGAKRMDEPVTYNRKEIPPGSQAFRYLHSKLPLARTQDSSGSLVGDSFGRIVYTYAQKLSQSDQPDGSALWNATEIVYTTFWAVAMNQLMQAPVQPQTKHASLLKNVTKLHADSKIAWALGVLLMLMLLNTLVILIHAELTHSILQEEPKSLLRLAMLLSRSDVMLFADDFKSHHLGTLEPGAYVEKYYTTKEAECWYEDQIGEVSGRIRLQGLKELVPHPTRWELLKQGIASLWPRGCQRDAGNESEMQSLRGS